MNDPDLVLPRPVVGHCHEQGRGAFLVGVGAAAPYSRRLASRSHAACGLGRREPPGPPPERDCRICDCEPRDRHKRAAAEREMKVSEVL